MMKLFSRKRVADPISHLNIEEIPRITLYNRQASGWGYRDGVVDEAVRRAKGSKTVDDLIDAIESAFLEYELMRWFAPPTPPFIAALDRLGVLGCEAAA